MNTEELTSTTQDEICWVPHLRSSGEDHWPVARANRGYDSIWVQSMGPISTLKGHATRNVSGVRLPRDVQEPGSGRKARAPAGGLGTLYT